ncbi:MAG: serine--tRNA ligase [Pseudomonadota bacterium]
MYDLKEIRQAPDLFDAGLVRRGVAPQAAAILALDEKARALTVQMNDAQAARNAASKAIGAAKAKGDEEAFNRLRAEVDALKASLPALEAEEKQIRDEILALLAGLPNAPADDVPDGSDETDNQKLREYGSPRNEDGLKQHFDLGEPLGMDFEVAARMSGSRFVLLRGQMARLERALGQFMLDLHTNEFGYEEVSPPLLVRDEPIFGVGQLPKFTEDLFTASDINKREELLDSALVGINETYRTTPEGPERLTQAIKTTLDKAQTREQFWLIPTAEAALTNIVREEVLGEEELPLRFTALTPCFRSEAGSAGRDTRGMIRVHQFLKVELVSITTPDTSDAEHERMTEAAETVLKRLDLPFRTMVLCAGDMGFSARKTYDLEVWLPGQQAYREISSCSNCGPFQARRMKARYKAGGEKQAQPVHTLNGSGLAVGRAMVAVMENYQEADGSITVPDALVPYMGGITKIG